MALRGIELAAAPSGLGGHQPGFGIAWPNPQATVEMNAGRREVAAIQGLDRSLVLPAGPHTQANLVARRANRDKENNHRGDPSSPVTDGQHGRPLRSETL